VTGGPASAQAVAKAVNRSPLFTAVQDAGAWNNGPRVLIESESMATLHAARLTAYDTGGRVGAMAG